MKQSFLPLLRKKIKKKVIPYEQIWETGTGNRKRGVEEKKEKEGEREEQVKENHTEVDGPPGHAPQFP